MKFPADYPIYTDLLSNSESSTYNSKGVPAYSEVLGGPNARIVCKWSLYAYKEVLTQ